MNVDMLKMQSYTELSGGERRFDNKLNESKPQILEKTMDYFCPFKSEVVLSKFHENKPYEILKRSHPIT